MHKSTGACSSTDGLQRCFAYLFPSPRDDVCATCEKMRHGVMDPITEEEKLLAVDVLKTHILQAQTVNKI
ncbi:hypothetical protein DPMN_066378 [Dreissena polymorpha]|uniref:Uncharacterized protein n=1 Tax=Dreissena polymorpha TaxID=45954 RepID=A0A9D3YVC1_DREPO|nr:hypothetical protein DPMN_066378 [Dreissena polymorpha]